MGDLGYQSNAQKSLVVNYNDLKSYLKTLCTAINKPYSRYQKLGLLDASGQQQQLNTSLLQIENEFYSAIRPKRTANTGETALTALFNRGVEYIEVRCVDINPFEPLGLSRNQAMFLDTFLWHCILQPSPPSTEHEYRAIQENQARTVNDGRDPELRLIQNGGEVKLRDWGRTLLATMVPVAEMLDATCGGVGYVQALDEQKQLLDNAELTPSGRILTAMREHNLSFQEFALALSKRNNEQIANSPRCESTMGHYQTMAKDSWQAQNQLEADQAKQTFEEFLQQYYKQYYFCSCPEFG
jgi:glutamate--cysteine ligase